MVEKNQPYILGLDLGVQSVGWAVVDIDDCGRPCGIRRSGVRCFDSGVGSESEIASGKDESQNTKRRQMRSQRRQLWRRARRQKKVFHLLQKAGLLPPGETHVPQQRHELLKSLDSSLAREFLPQSDRIAAHLLPYRLRSLALDQQLPPFAFGRALFHLAQRRGFLSNRKTQAKEDKESGEVKAGIANLWASIQEAGARTLGEYFAGLDPEEQRIRKRWTARQMYLDEFDKIWETQSGHLPKLDDDLKRLVHQAIFHQRPLKSQKNLVGRCELEPDCLRAPKASLEAQRFRYLQKINDLEIIAPDGEILPLSQEQRTKLIDAFECNSERKFDQIRAVLGLKTPRGATEKYTFNLEAGGEKKLRGNSTAAKLRKALGANYDKLHADQLAAIVDDLLEYEKKDALVKRFVQRYGIAPAKAEDLADVVLEDGYASLSRAAFRKVLPLMERGIPFATARKEVYGAYGARKGLHDFLPPVLDVVELRNPVVCRGLTELRKVVNALIREYGRPDLIRIELARDLKRSRKQREDLTKQNRENEKSREAARAKIADRLHCDPDAVSNTDILKIRLAEECNWECPYTGKSIPIESLLGRDSQFDIEHIIPFSRSLDNSFSNKTLCHHAENRDVKRNQTPYEAYAGDEKRWLEIVGRVKRFRSSAAHAKFRKFQQKELDADWANRMLQDTRYMSRLATDYLGLLYGGQIDDANRRRVQVSAGRVTAYLRDEWKMNALLADGDEDEKNRGDHRHHAVDAVAIAMTDASTVKQLSNAAETAEQQGHRLFVPMDLPWPTFINDVRASINAINVSYRVNRRVSGAFHEETNYSKPQKAACKNGKTVEYRHVRKPLQNMSPNEVESIVDPTIRGLVQTKLSQIGGIPQKVFADPGNHPYLTTKDGRRVFIHKARIRKTVAVTPLGSSNSPRFVAPGSNHHMEICATIDDQGYESKWEANTVTLVEAYGRVREGRSVIEHNFTPGKRFKFSLSGGECLELEQGSDQRQLVRVTVISGKVVEFRLHNDARPITLLRQTKGGRAGLSKPVDSLRKAKARKVVVDPLGNILPAND